MTRDDPYTSRTFVRDRRTWIATLILGVALWFGTTLWLNRHVSIAARRAAGPGDESRLVVLAFDRVGGAGDGAHLDRTGLREALRSLSHAGWQAVSTRFALALLTRRTRGGQIDIPDRTTADLECLSGTRVRPRRTSSRVVSWYLLSRAGVTRATHLYTLQGGM